jgi:hypothetical protein
MPKPARRIVTGHDDTGRSVVLSDGMPPNVRDKGTGVDFIEIWNTSATPAPICSHEPEPTDGPLRVPPPPHGTRIRLNDFHPGHILKLPERLDGRHRMMHRTRSIDYGIAKCCCAPAMWSCSAALTMPGKIARIGSHAWRSYSWTAPSAPSCAPSFQPNSSCAADGLHTQTR